MSKIEIESPLKQITQELTNVLDFYESKMIDAK
jgi:hypothetical protein